MSIRKHSSWRKRMFTQVVDRDGPSCAMCSAPHRITCGPAGVFSTNLYDGFRYTKVIWRSTLDLDHRVPLHVGGSNELDNLWLLCRDCHKTKTSAEQSARLKALGAGRNVPR